MSSETTTAPQLQWLRDEPVSLPAACCTFVGALDYFPNVDGIIWFCDHVWPMLRRMRPSASLTLVGRKPTRAVERLGELPGVNVVGTVPDVRPYLRRAQVSVVPLRIARGIQNKVLESMAMSRPVVISPQAVEGLPRPVADAAIVAVTPAEWAEQIEYLLQNPAVAQERGARGYAAVKDTCCWADCLEQMESLLEETAATGRRYRPAPGRIIVPATLPFPAGRPSVQST